MTELAAVHEPVDLCRRSFRLNEAFLLVKRVV
jgi:hypothetical protein